MKANELFSLFLISAHFTLPLWHRDCACTFVCKGRHTISSFGNARTKSTRPRTNNAQMMPAIKAQNAVTGMPAVSLCSASTYHDAGCAEYFSRNCFGTSLANGTLSTVPFSPWGCKHPARCQCAVRASISLLLRTAGTFRRGLPLLLEE